MIDNGSIKRMWDVGLRDVFRYHYIPKVLRKKGKTKLTLEQFWEWSCRFRDVKIEKSQ